MQSGLCFICIIIIGVTPTKEGHPSSNKDIKYVIMIHS